MLTNPSRAVMNGVLFALAAFVYWLLFADAFAWVQPEYFLRWLPKSLENGFDLTWRDLFQAFNWPAHDGAPRPRFLSYLLSAITAKLRIMAYDYIVPPPNLSPVFVISIIASPILFYKFALNFLGDRMTAITSMLLYLTSVGFISSTSFLYHPGKCLVNVAALLLLWALSRMNLTSWPFGHSINRQAVAVMFLNMVGIAIDETYFLISVCAVLLFPALFFSAFHRGNTLFYAARPLILYFSPYLVFLVFVALAPNWGRVSGVAPSGSYFVHLSSSIAQANYFSQQISATTGPLWYTSAISLKHVIGNVVYPGYIFTIYPLAPHLQLLYWLAIVVFMISALLVMYRHRMQAVSTSAMPDTRQQNFIFIRLIGSFVAFIIVSTAVQRLHSGVITGYYYGSMALIFTSLIAAFTFAGPHARRYILFHALVIVFAICGVSNGYNSTTGNDYNHAVYVTRVHNGESTDTYPFMTKVRFPDIQLDAVKNRGPHQNNHGQRAEMERIRQLWRNGSPVDLNGLGHWPAQDTWFLAEMFYVYERSRKAP